MCFIWWMCLHSRYCLAKPLTLCMGYTGGFHWWTWPEHLWVNYELIRISSSLRERLLYSPHSIYVLISLRFLSLPVSLSNSLFTHIPLLPADHSLKVSFMHRPTHPNTHIHLCVCVSSQSAFHMFSKMDSFTLPSSTLPFFPICFSSPLSQPHHSLKCLSLRRRAKMEPGTAYWPFTA